MTKKILISLGIIGIVAAVTVGLTTAYFSDEEVSTGNVFAAGTIDIHLTDLEDNIWTGGAEMLDMKPCYTDYVNFKIYNDEGEDANPVNVWKDLINFEETTGIETEPECTDQGGVWDYNSQACDWDGSGTLEKDYNNLSKHIWYDLYVEVYDNDGDKIWYQTIYVDEDEQSLDDVFKGDKNVYLGMIPAGGWMYVEQSYHLAPNVGNWAQGDKMTFDIEVYAEQLHGEVTLENKEQGPELWHLKLGDDITGTLTYHEVKGPTFDFEFTGKAPLSDMKYYLIAGGTPSTGGWDPDTELGYGTSSTSGDISFSGNPDLGKDLKNAKVWLVPKINWNGSIMDMDWTGWPGCQANFLWETGLIWYEDTDL